MSFLVSRFNQVIVGLVIVTLMAFAVEPVLVSAQEVQPNIPQTAPELIQPTPGNSVNSANAGDEVIYTEKGLNLFELLRKGGWFMIPLALLSILVVALAIERALALREEKILPKQLVRELGNLSRHEEGFDPRMAFRACQVYPSAASRVLRVMLLKAGRPQSEVERAVSEAAEREATKCQALVSWLVLAAAVAPLVGLLGTVWGMIQAFYDTTQLTAGVNKGEVLAQGIYTALVTTLCGLCIAIPSAVLAHFFDNRIVAWFHKIEELAASLTPMMEQFEGQVRASAPAKGAHAMAGSTPADIVERSAPNQWDDDPGRGPQHDSVDVVPPPSSPR